MIHLEHKTPEGWKTVRNYVWDEDKENVNKLVKRMRKLFSNHLDQIRLTIGNGSGKDKTEIYFT